MSKALFAALQELAASKPTQTIPPDTIKAYYKHLQDLPEPAVLAAIDTAIKTTGAFIPSIGEIRDIVAQMAHDTDDLAETAWMDVQRQIRRIGYQPRAVFRDGAFIEQPEPEFANARTAEAVASIGWKNLCLNDPGEMRREFIFTYRNLRKRDTGKVQRGDLGDFLTALNLSLIHI